MKPGEKQRDAERTRTRLLAAAINEFSAHGFAATRLSDVALRAGVNPQLITYYFQGKRGIYQAARSRWRSRLRQEAAGTTSLPS